MSYTATKPSPGSESQSKRERQQRTRLAVMYRHLALSWAISVLTLSLFALGQVTSAAVPLVSAVLGVTICGGVTLAFRRGWNLQMRDPNMTLMQMVLVVATQIGLLSWAPEVGFFVLMELFLTLTIGGLRLSLRPLLVFSATCGLAAGMAIFAVGARLTLPVATPLELGLLWVGFVSVLGRYAYLMVYVNRLRESLHQRNKQLSGYSEQIEMMARIDELTQVYNRRHIVDMLREEKSRADRTGVGFSVAMFDLDHFKAINDRFGHSMGDEALKAFVENARASIRATDKLGRYGGEEFVVLLAAASQEVARVAAERVRAAVAAHDWGAVAPGLAVTVSVGVTDYRQGEAIEQTLDRADQALYQAKGAGRNRVVQI